MENRHSPPPSRTVTSPAPSPARPLTSRWPVWFSTGFGVGYLPVMPGTYGSAEGVLLYLGLAWGLRSNPHGLWILCLALLLLTALSWWLIARALPHFTSDDPSAIVIDEVAGQGLTLLGIALVRTDLSWSWLSVAVGFILFRAFDALKPYPIWKLGHWKGALGVLADDVGAAIVAGLALYGLGRLGWL
jgi:phosphatidylglycerophosphatase A